MALQTNVNTTLALGVPGQEVVPGQTVYSPVNPVAETEVTVGNFVFQGTDPYAQVKNTGSVVAGLAQRVQMYPMYDLATGASLTIPEGSAVSCAIRGAFYVTAKTDATVGQAAFASTTDGSISTAAVGGTVADAVETNWIVKKGGTAGETIVISNWEA